MAVQKRSPHSRSLQSTVWTRVVALLGSVRCAIFLLTFIGVSSIIGTLVEQQGPAERSLAKFSEDGDQLIHVLGLSDVFHSWWFVLSVGALGLNLILCTLSRTKSLLQSRDPEKLPKESVLKGFELHFVKERAGIERLVGSFKNYKVILNSTQGVILERGRIADYGVLVIHGSILLILLGGLIGISFGYQGSLTLSVGQSKDAIAPHNSPAIQMPFGFAVRCADFRLHFYETGEPKEFISSLEVIEGGRVVLNKDIRVNDPLTYKGVSFYQASYGYTTVSQFTINGKNAELVEGNRFQEGDMPLMVSRAVKTAQGTAAQVAYLDNGKPKYVWFLKDDPRFREQAILGVPVKLQDIRQVPFTGLTVTKDPGLFLVWSGFFFMLCGLFISFGFYRRRLYLLKQDRGVLVAGTSRKNKEEFGREFQRLKEMLNAE